MDEEQGSVIVADIKPVKSDGRPDRQFFSRLTSSLDLRYPPVLSGVSGGEAKEIEKKLTQNSFQQILKTSPLAGEELQQAVAAVGGEILPSFSPLQSFRRRAVLISSLARGEADDLTEQRTGATISVPARHYLPPEEDKKLVERPFIQRETFTRPPSLRSLRGNLPLDREIEKLLRGTETAAAEETKEKISPSSFPVTDPVKPEPALFSDQPKQFNFLNHLRRVHWSIWSGIILLLALGLIAGQGNNFKKRLQGLGQEGVRFLQQAQQEAGHFDFDQAAGNFALAYGNFSRASEDLNFWNQRFTDWLVKIPGLEKLKNARDLVTAGENMAKAGENLSLALASLYRTNFVNYLGLGIEPPRPLTDFVNDFRDSLVFSRARLLTAAALLEGIEAANLPADYQSEFTKFRFQLSQFNVFLDRAVEYADFLLAMLGESAPKRYLVLFQNNAELRPTGGFPGSYAIIRFNRGFLRELMVDDVYNIDGQARQLIIPPRELQHITANWGMRDANWFINFPDSARQIMKMYTEIDGGLPVDGVLTITPTVIEKILAVTGPIELPAYGKTLTSDNFAAEIQGEIEYGANREQPKTILKDFVPQFITYLSQQNQEQWFKVIQILLEGLERKHILAYFNDPYLQKLAKANGLTGEIDQEQPQTPRDFLMITHSNIKGSKTDLVIDDFYNLTVDLKEDNSLLHSLEISRQHRGGQKDLGFYNRTNYDFLRVAVPADAELLEINGQTAVSFSPLVDYRSADYQEDEFLKKYETDSLQLKPNVRQFQEAGRQVWGFWLSLAPGEKKTVRLKYKTSLVNSQSNYLLLVQKQPGTFDDQWQLTVRLPDDRRALFQYPTAGWITENYQDLRWQGTLNTDLVFGLEYH